MNVEEVVVKTGLPRRHVTLNVSAGCGLALEFVIIQQVKVHSMHEANQMVVCTSLFPTRVSSAQI